MVDTIPAAEDRQVRGGDVDGAAPGVRDGAVAEFREEVHEITAHALDHAWVELQAVERAAAEAHATAAPAEGDAAVARRPQVMQHRPAVADRLAAGPTDLLDHVRYRLGEHDVARRDGQR